MAYDLSNSNAMMNNGVVLLLRRFGPIASSTSFSLYVFYAIKSSLAELIFMQFILLTLHEYGCLV